MTATKLDFCTLGRHDECTGWADGTTCWCSCHPILRDKGHTTTNLRAYYGGDVETVRVEALRRLRELLQLKSTASPSDIVQHAEWLVENYKRVTSNLQECVQRHQLGLGGEQVDGLVCDEIDRLRSAAAGCKSCDLSCDCYCHEEGDLGDD